ncbi:putative HTH-type transcriptional regulator YcxD [Bacillus subtilis subsp. subtilis]|nr:putative HTH-type transcriptional regulator YcxD [Bacillus subtilis subsp. subtilis]
MEKYMSLVTRIEEMMQSTAYQEGDRLPSIRQMSARYQVSKSTVIRALQELEKRHLIYSVPKSGYYIVKKTGKSKSGQPGPIDFATSAPDPDVFPYLDFQHCINKAIDTYKNDLFIYGTPKGLPSLIRVLRKLLANQQVLRMNGIFSLHQVSSRRYLCFVPCRSQMGKRRSPLNSRATI